jgi:hypothetical protein
MRLALLAVVIVVSALAAYAELLDGSRRAPVEEYRLSVGKDNPTCNANDCTPAVVPTADTTSHDAGVATCQAR